MKIKLTFETTHGELIRCITAAWKKDCEQELDTDAILPFVSGDKLNHKDVENMLLGSCLAIISGNAEMEVV